MSALREKDPPDRLNILFLTTWYPSDKDPIEGIFVREHAKVVAKAHNLVVLYARHSGQIPICSWKISSDRLEEGIRTVRLQWRGFPLPKMSLPFQLLAVLAVYRKIKKAGFLPDLIHAHVYNAALSAVILARLIRKPVVITAHASLILLGNLRKMGLPHAIYGFRRADMILPVSVALQQSMQQQGVRNRYRVVPNAVDTDVFSLGASERQSIPRLLTIGISEPKGIPFLLRAVRIARDNGSLFRLDIVGDGAMKAEYEALSAELGLQDDVVFHGMKDKAEVARFMQECAFYVQPSLWETFGVAIVEAMACGKPIVATRIPAIEDKVSDRAGILVPADDDEALAFAIEKMLGSYGSYDASEIASYASERFGHEAVGRALNDVYLQVIDNTDHTRGSLGI